MTTQTDYPTFDARTLRRLIDGLGMTQREFAEHLGYDKATINRMLLGRQPVTRKFSLLVSHVYNIPLDDEAVTR